MDEGPVDDRQLLAAVAAGDEAAFEALYDRFARPLYALGLRWLGDVRDAEELVSETLARAWQGANRYDPRRARPASWLFGIARFVASEQRRRHRAATAGLDLVADLAGESGADELIAAWDMAVALEQLPAAQREVLILAYEHDLSQSQIADLLGVPLGTVKSRAYYGLRALAELVEAPPTVTQLSEATR